ncbi:2,2-dialkylglycine decarboxylase [Verticillium dahliae VdLs.17]|uniref:2,2-dialkylglycine decarboxylase n=1 Tax=Verticillium dahliae (strain VdLs.17 / ATCC MYA-4575 / FGSC 10137) TaxID=498257 RepID=G2XG71_VERDV|nr:2,2-dialkylglycine decarboxylase [Verticillium dahliae VdLs.17]EGY18890.1 2,2-dialkylglycine decarboxylase [Verticillium dahliae VdLs.17]
MIIDQIMPKSAVLHRDLRHQFLQLASCEGHYCILTDGRKIFDSSGDAAVACLGHGHPRVLKAIRQQDAIATYCATTFFAHSTSEELCQLLVDSTEGHMSKAYIVSSGSEAMEAAMKLSRQFFLEQTPAQRTRYRFISRSRSYHGITLGALSVGGHAGRRANFEPMMCNNTSVVSPCFSYRGQASHETDAMYVARLAKELEDEFIRLGPHIICAFVAEPVVGAALGCVPAVPGYFKAMKAVCEKYGALLILVEVMCGMGRTGTLHAWQDEGVVPDLQTIGKGLGGGY